ALLIFYAFYQVFMVKESMFGFNRFFLVFALCFSLVVPFLPVSFGFQIQNSLFPEDSLKPVPLSVNESHKDNTSSQPTWEQAQTETSPEAPPAHPFHWTTFLTGIYLLGLILFVTRFVLQWVRLVR